MLKNSGIAIDGYFKGRTITSGGTSVVVRAHNAAFTYHYHVGKVDGIAFHYWSTMQEPNQTALDKYLQRVITPEND